MKDHENDEKAKQEEYGNGRERTAAGAAGGGESANGVEAPEWVLKWIIIPLLVIVLVIPRFLFDLLAIKIKMFREFREWQRRRFNSTGKTVFTPIYRPLFLCNNRCGWQGSTEPTAICPDCGAGTYHTPSTETGCSIFYRSGRDLRIRNTGVSMMRGQEAHVEAADIIDLLYYIVDKFPEELGDRQMLIRHLENGEQTEPLRPNKISLREVLSCIYSSSSSKGEN